jgi:hypothetical protein
MAREIQKSRSGFAHCGSVNIKRFRPRGHFGRFGFLIFSHDFDGLDLYGASSFFETMPSRPSSQTALNISPPSTLLDILNAARSSGYIHELSLLPLLTQSGHVQRSDEYLRCAFADLLGLDSGGLNDLRPFGDIGLDAAREFFRRAVDCIKT